MTEKGKTMRDIDADALEQEFCNGCRYEHNKYSNCIDCAVANAPTVDAVEVVRCVDCKWFQDERNEFTGSDGFCPNVAHGVSEDWFCADGERREEDDLPTSANHDGEGKE